MSRWKSPAVLALISIAVAGCQTTSAGCPALKSYTRAQMQAVAAELAKNPNTDVAAFIADYGQLRSACRALMN